MVFPVVLFYRCESSITKKAECQRIDAFELWYWRMEKTLESPLDSKAIKSVNPKGNQPWIFIEKTDVGNPQVLSSSFMGGKKSPERIRLKLTAGGE